MALQALSDLQTLQLIPVQPSLQLQLSPSRLGRFSPSASDPHTGVEQSSPPKPGGQEHLPLYLLQGAKWVQL